MHLICINHNNIINKPFSAKKGRSNFLYMCLDIHAKFRGDRLKGGQIDPPPSKNLLSKSPVKIGLMYITYCFLMSDVPFSLMKMFMKLSTEW